MPEWVQWANENWQHIIIPVVILIAFIVGGRWLRRIIYEKLNRWAKKTSHLGLALFVSKLYGPFLFWFVLLGISVATRVSILPLQVTSMILTVLLSLFVASWIWIAVGISNGIVRLYLPKARQYMAKVKGPQPPTGLVVNSLRTVFIVVGSAILLDIWKLPNLTGLLVMILAFTIGILALREASAHISKRVHLSWRTQKRMRSTAKVFLSLMVLAGIVDVIRRIYVLANAGPQATLSIVILFLEIGFIVWFITILRSANYRTAKPSFKLVTALSIITVLILAFAGVQPLNSYKDTTVAFFKDQAEKVNEFYASESPPVNTTEVVKNVSPAIVRIESDQYVGTGMIIDKTGYILTCEHVIKDDPSIDVILNDGKQFNATVVSKDQYRDLAIIKINANSTNYSTIKMGNPSALQIGQEIIIIGYALGLEGETSISKGIVSAFRNEDGINYIQTDAAVNPGCSGGPMLNSQGEAVGVVSFKLAGEAVESMGFAVSMEEAKLFINSVIETDTTEPLNPGEQAVDSIKEMELEVMTLANEERLARGISPLTWDDTLHSIAREHSGEMAERGELFHSSMNEPYAENCWGGSSGSAWYFNASDIVNGWMESDKHRTWLLCPHIEHVGVGIVVNSGEMYASWTFWRNETAYSDWWYVDGSSPPPWWY